MCVVMWETMKTETFKESIEDEKYRRGQLNRGPEEDTVTWNISTGDAGRRSGRRGHTVQLLETP